MLVFANFKKDFNLFKRLIDNKLIKLDIKRASIL